MKMSNTVYDILRKVSLIIPLFATFYCTVADAWNLPYSGPIGITCGALVVLLEGICQVSSKVYWKNEKERKEHFDALDD